MEPKKKKRETRVFEHTDIEISAPSFITFNNLSPENRNFFVDSGLFLYLNIASGVLGKRLGPAAERYWENPYLSPDGLNSLNSMIADILEMIGHRTNKGIGENASAQNSFFLAPEHRESFPMFLNLARWDEKFAELVRKDPNNKKLIERNIIQLDQETRKEVFGNIKGAHKITYGRSKMTETETRAVGVFYMMELIWRSLQDGQIRPSSEPLTLSNLAPVLRYGFHLHALFFEWNHFTGSALGGESKRKVTFPESLKIIEKLVRKDPKIATNILARRARDKIARYASHEKPSARWIENEVRRRK